MLLLFLELRGRIFIMLIGSCMPSSPKESHTEGPGYDIQCIRTYIHTYIHRVCVW